MGTANFKTMDYDMPMVCMEYNLFCDLADNDNVNFDSYGDEVLSMYEDAQCLADDFSLNLTFHEVTVEPGYYDGFQFFVKEIYNDKFDLDEKSIYCLDDDDAYYYFEMTKEEALEKSNIEKQKIKKWLNSLAANGYERLECLGTYSNGEAIYERA